jgi:hypothetical protein
MQSLGSSRTPPPSRGVSASVGQTLAHGGFSQARQTMTTNPLLMPPSDRTWMHEPSKPPRPKRLAQANIHDWQPTQRSASRTDNLFAMMIPPSTL